jgi:hypothetical protein
MLGALGLAGCTVNDVKVPDLSGPTEGRGSYVIGAPSPTPNPQPTPTPQPTPAPQPTPGQPTPQPTPNPTPAPTPNPGPTAKCALGPGQGSGDNCDRTSPAFLDQVETAIDRTVARHPDYFDLRNAKCANCYRIVDPDGLVNGVIAELNAMGLCAAYDGEELAVKSSNDSNDQYDIITADMYLLRGKDAIDYG